MSVISRGLRVLLDDGTIAVVEKTAGVSVSAGDETDLLARAKVHFGGYVAAHHLLGRDVSGPVLLLREQALNAAVAAMITRGELTMDIAAVVTHRGGKRTLYRERGVTKIVDVRRKLTQSGNPVVGDGEQHGALWPRVALHVEQLTFVHPKTNEKVTVRSELPPTIDRAISDDRELPTKEALARVLEDAFDRRAGIQNDDTTVVRAAHEAGDEVPGVAIDAYGDFAVLHLSSDAAIARRQEIADVLVSLGAVGVYAKSHPRKASTLVDSRRDDVAPLLPIAGTAAPDVLLVRERGLILEAHLGDGLATGVYLDQRENRRAIRERSSGKRVLNLFAYTCPFSVAAAAGGATRTISVDTAKIALAWGERNLSNNGYSESGQHSFVVEDAVTYLKRAIVRRDRFDIVVLDPPSFATTKTARFSVENDLAAITADALRVLSPGGLLFVSTNNRGLTRKSFNSVLRLAAAKAERGIASLVFGNGPVDFPAPPGGEPHLKSAFLTVK